MIKYMSSPESKGSFFVDTPEGSLDIAYESRAGDMFARFVQDGFGIIMTANINTSRLLISLAEKCGKREMNWVWLLWNDGPGGVETALVLIDVELPVTIKIS